MVAYLMGLLLTAAQVQPQDASVTPQIVTLVPPAEIEGAPLRQPPDSGYVCVPGFADCVRVIRDEDNRAQIQAFDMDAASRDTAPIALPDAVAQDDGMDVTMWGQAVRLPTNDAAGSGIRAYLVGVIRRTPVSYSGGFASGERLHLFQLMLTGDEAWLGPELVSLPWTSTIEIRACVSDEDSERRRGACHDIYRYVPTLTASPAGDGGSATYPALTYATTATAYPRTSRRDEDSDTERPLSEADLVEWRDPECSYARTLLYNPATQRYEMDQVAPDCGDYTNP